MINNKVIIDIKTKNTPYLNDLNCYGFKYNEKEMVWIKDGVKSESFLQDIKRFCKKRSLDYQIIDNNFERNSSYRKDFFEHHKNFKNYYFCAYCGKIYKKNQITVDHIISISAAKKHKYLRKILKFFGVENINDIKNLTPACSKCNSKKSSDLKGWVIKGFLGKYEKLWIPRIALEISLCFLIFYSLTHFMTYNNFWFLQ